MSRFRIASMLAGFAVAAAVSGVLAAPASAATGGDLSCTINPGGTFDGCSARQASTSYGITFQVEGVTDTSNPTFAWTVQGTKVAGTCTSTSSSCSLTARGFVQNQSFTVSVVVTDSSGSETLTNTATIAAVCKAGGQIEFC